VIIVSETRAHSWYTGMEVGVRRRVARGYGGSLAYTWATSENDTDGRTVLPQDPTNILADRGPAPNDARHRLTLSGIVSLPFDVQLSTVVSARTAAPYNITTGTDDNRDFILSNDRPAGVQRNSARGAAYFSADVRLTKNVSAGHSRLQIIAEAFNVTNHANRSDYNGVQAAVSFGVPASAGPPRQLQLGVRLNF
jgi:hypothetical protein